ncbi:glycosyltransferase family 4 protein [Sciscionella sediminilitoris]|uniref:glycosyltransferase family 4 protein n=1 Tax=Sciscionella sediminilitoris TaxID=1445613 RepID=UPI000690DCA9|nr:glycosyltransferase family 4 protein [Sciscionella sp. SE31]
MRVVALVHFMTPIHNAGSEKMAEHLLAALAEAGHTVTAVVTAHRDGPDEYTHRGFRVIRSHTPETLIPQLDPDVILTHHQETATAARIGVALGVPVVFLIHNDMPHTRAQLSEPHAGLVFNTQWIAARLAEPGIPSIVVAPPVDPGAHRSTPGECVTLVNLNADKGAGIFYQLAERLPDIAFLGVIGGHGAQVMCRYPNLRIVDNTTDMRTVWTRTRVLVMPSIYESYGMVGVEAAASGIPTVATPTPGLRESLGDAGIFVNHDDIDGWIAAVSRLCADAAVWEAASARARARSAELAALDARADFVAWLEKLALRWMP